MKLEEVIRQLLGEDVNPSIRYRLCRELLGDAPDSPGMTELQAQIMASGSVKELMAAQKEDGWIGHSFHGYDSLEGAIRFLCDKGVEPQQPVLAKALAQVEQNFSRAERELGKVGTVLDDGKYGGTSMMRAALLARAGLVDHALVKEQVEIALDGLRQTREIKSIADVCEPYRGKQVFKAGAVLPSIYHLRLLAHTQDWRTAENKAVVVEGVRRLVQLSPMPEIHIRRGSQLIAPAMFGMQDFVPEMEKLSDAGWFIWFQRMELLARMGIVPEIRELTGQVDVLLEMLDESGGWFDLPLRHAYFHKWGAYTGLALEEDWRTAQRRKNDLTFRALLIGYYAGF